MGKTSGFVLILAGLAVGAYALHGPPPAGFEIATALRLIGPPGGEADGSSPAVKATEKPANEPAGSGASPSPQPASKPPAESLKSDNSSVTCPPPPGAVPLAPLAPVPAPERAKRPEAAVAATEVDADAAPTRVPIGEGRGAPPPPDGAELTSEIQRHLKRIGCYRGDVTGIWSPSVREAMLMLTERTNSALPVDGPDPVLLAMVERQSRGVCDAGCPRGQERVAEGRCVPNALVAAGDKATGEAKDKGSGRKAGAPGDAAKTRPVQGAVAGRRPPDTSAPAAVRQPARGRMSVAGPPAADVRNGKASRRQTRSRQPVWVAKPPRLSQGRRVRRAQRPPSYSGYSSVPYWVLPFLSP